MGGAVEAKGSTAASWARGKYGSVVDTRGLQIAPGALNRTEMIRLQWIASEMQRKEAISGGVLPINVWCEQLDSAEGGVLQGVDLKNPEGFEGGYIQEGFPLNVIVVRGDMDLGWDCGIAKGKVRKERGRLSRGRGGDAEVDVFGRKECANALIVVLRPVAVPQESRVPPG
eukprot:gene389-408_t